MPFKVVSKGPNGVDTRRAPQKTICNPEPDGPSGPSTTKLVQRSPEAPKPILGSLAGPLDAMVTADRRRRGLSCGRALQPAEISRLRSGADLPETHPGCVSGGARWLIRLSPGTTGRTGPTVGRRMRLRVGERRIRQQLQSKRPDLASPSATTRSAFCYARKVSYPIAPFETTL